MAGPLAGISAAQIAQQKLQEQGAGQAAKAGPSKFDGAMKAQQPGQAQAVGQAQQAQQAHGAGAVNHVQMAKQIENVNKLDQMRLNKIGANGSSGASTAQSPKAIDPVTQKGEASKATNSLMGMFGDMEKGQASLDKLINGSMNGKSFNNSELLALQAGMYKYTQELDLTSKVVEKATSGLKDTLKTQV